MTEIKGIGIAEQEGQRKYGKTARRVGRFAWSAAGGAGAIGLALWLVHSPSSPFLLASLGGSTVFLFGLTSAPAAQPRALFGGHLGGALIGILCAQAFGGALWVYVLALVLTLVFMLGTGTVHPPAGANPLIMVHQHATLAAFWDPVGLGVLVLFLVALVWSRLLPGTVRYPTGWLQKSPPPELSAW